jgi:hypothetical protein
VGIDIEGNMFVARGKVFELNESGTWVNTAELFPTDPENLRFNFPYFELIYNGSDFGQTVVIKDGVVFIGAPRKDYESIWDVGAVYIYKKNPGEHWTSRSESGKIIPQLIQESGLFGASLAPLDGSILIGAPVSEYFKNGDLNSSVKKNVPGKTMLFQARDAGWKSFYHVKTFTGETGVLDNFGHQVQIDENNIFISAPMEDIHTGRISGSVYISDKPPTLSPVPDLCGGIEGQITLASKQSGGTWSGRGIVDSARGIFDAIVAGEGVHEITYTLPGCSLQGKIDITIHKQPMASLTGDNNYLTCAENPYISIPIQLQTIPDYDYQWYYRKNENEAFALMNHTTAAIMAEQRGDYRARVYNGACEALSDTISVRDESLSLQLDSLDRVCGTPSSGLELSASPPGGVWSGPGIYAGNKFSIQGIPDGHVKLLYRYYSVHGCQYEKEMLVDVKRLPVPNVDRAGNLCDEGVVNLTLRGPEAAGASYSWSHKAENEGSYSVTGSGSALETTYKGSYILSSFKDGCEARSIPIMINDMFSVAMSPESERSEVCYGSEFQFSFPSNANSKYEWYFSADGNNFNMMTESSGSLVPTRSGYYYGVETRGLCTVTSPAKFVYLHPKDSVFVPNIMTPNGDNMNDTFSIHFFRRDDAPGGGDAADGISYEVFNRWGRQIFSAPGNQPWTGDNAESGIYFWQGGYYACNGTPMTVKGWVQVTK